MNPKLIDINDYELSGGGKLGESYIRHDNPDVLLKLYPPKLEYMGLEEYEKSRKVFDMGIPCPEPGELVRTTDGRLGIQFQRIIGKKSYARAVSEHPERLNEYAAQFADLCKMLHSTKPEPGLFPTAKSLNIKGIMANPYLSDDEKKGLERFISTLPDEPTAVHGDLHFGNAIFTEDGRKYLIDLSDFCTGSPLFDIGIILLQTCIIPEEMEMELYHMNKTLSKAFWAAFVKEYYNNEKTVDEVVQMVTPYAFLRILVVEPLLGGPVTMIRPAVHAMIGIK